MDETRGTPPRAQQPLPFDDEAHHPVPYALTARARREVAPQDVPDLTVVGRAPSGRAGGDPDEGALDTPGDTRPARARALRRAGTPIETIARTLQVDELAVRAWLGDLAGRGAAHPVRLVREEQPRSRASRAFERACARAAVTGPDRLADDPAFAAGLGLVAGIAEVDEHSVSVATADPRVAAAVVRWLVDHAGARPGRLRVVLRLAPGAAADVARHRWARALGLPLEQIAHTRSRGTPAGEEQALVRLADVMVAGTVSGWSRALLDPPSPEPVDAAF